MVTDAPTRTRPDLDRLAEHRDPEGRKSYLTIYADLTDRDWEQVVKSRMEETRRSSDEIEADAMRLHEAFDKAYIALERAARQGANGVVVFVSPVHELEVVHILDGPIETKVVQAAEPDLVPLTD